MGTRGIGRCDALAELFQGEPTLADRGIEPIGHRLTLGV
jgi:hypothetical protein